MKKTVFYILLYSLIVPMIQEAFSIIKLKELSGVTIKLEKPVFSFTEWFDGKFQNDVEKFCDQNFGLRNFFIRLFNSVDYLLFKKTHANVIIGKNGYLFEGGYLDEITGLYYIGDDSMRVVISELKKIQNYLDSKNVSLLFVIAPSKTYYYNEYLPEYTAKHASNQRNYYSLIQHSEENKIRYIDFNKWFMSIKDTVSFPLFPKGGVHWSHYGMALCADSILHFISENKHIQLPELTWNLEFSNRPRGNENDVGELMNIWSSLSSQKMAYPKFKVVENGSTKKIRILAISDSFYWTIYNEGIFRKAFEKETYYYYCGSIYPNDAAASTMAMDLDLIKEVEKYDVVMLLQSSLNYGLPGVNFVQMFSSEMKKKTDYQLKITDKLNENFEKLVGEGKIKSISSLKKEDAIHFLADSLTNARFTKIADIKIRMRKSNDWLQQIKNKSSVEKITVEAMMQQEAEKMCDLDEEKFFDLITKNNL